MPEQGPTDGPQFKRDQQQPAANRPPQGADQRDMTPQSSRAPRSRPSWNPTRMLTTITEWRGQSAEDAVFRGHCRCGGILGLEVSRACPAGAGATVAGPAAPVGQPVGRPSRHAYRNADAVGSAGWSSRAIVCQLHGSVCRRHSRALHDGGVGPLQFRSARSVGPRARLCRAARTRRRWNMRGRSLVVTPTSVWRLKCWPISTAAWLTAARQIASHRRDHLRRLWQHLRRE